MTSPRPSCYTDNCCFDNKEIADGGKKALIRIAIVEDEAHYRTQLTEYLRQYGKERGLEFQILAFADGDEIAEDYDCTYDIVLLDIQMPFMDGMTAAEKIREKDSDVILMFITNMTNYAIKGYAVDALDYVLKPISYFSFASRMDKAVKKLPQKEQGKSVSLPLRSGGVQKVDISEIRYIESEGHILAFHTLRGVFRTYGKLKDYETKLQNEGFFRSNKGYLVNLRRVDAVADGGCVIGDDNLIISRAKKKEFLAALAEYM